MSLQTDLEDAIARIKADSQKIHDIAHGDDQSVVSTDGGNVKTVAKAVKDIETNIQTQLTNLGATAITLNAKVAKAEKAATTAGTHVATSKKLVNSLNLPPDLTGYGGQLLGIKKTEDGYEPIPSTAVFYGLRRDGAKLILETGQGTFDANKFATWMVAPPGLTFSVASNGHLKINI